MMHSTDTPLPQELSNRSQVTAGSGCRRLELLSPAGDRLCVTAAVENGADAVYFGLECGFNARVRATNLHLDTLPEAMAFLHERGVHGYVALNTLVFPAELKTIEQHIVRLAEAGVDAVLVQDLGLARLLRVVSPDLRIHASTQMTLASGECIQAAEELGSSAWCCRASFPFRKFAQFAGKRRLNSKRLCMAPCAWRIRGNA